MVKQFKSLYRYGEMAECSQKHEDFKFCMSSKGLHPEEKRDAWIRRERALQDSQAFFAQGGTVVDTGKFILVSTLFRLSQTAYRQLYASNRRGKAFRPVGLLRVDGRAPRSLPHIHQTLYICVTLLESYP